MMRNCCNPTMLNVNTQAKRIKLFLISNIFIPHFSQNLTQYEPKTNATGYFNFSFVSVFPFHQA